MVRALTSAGYQVVATDIASGVDFLDCATVVADAIITNPPYTLAQAFIERGLELADVVAMLLRTDYDHAAGRAHLFGGCPAFAKKLVLTKRIVWFEGPKAAPSFNHAWYIWHRGHADSPMLAYGP